MKFSLLLCVVVLFALVAFTAASKPSLEATKNATGIHWNVKARITADIIKNATEATQQGRVLLRNGTIGHPTNAVFINGTWQVPVNQTAANLAAAAAANNTAALSIGVVPGCDMNVPSDFTVDKIVGEWCSTDVHKGGFLFRGLRDKHGKLFLQRFTFKNHKSLNKTAILTVNGTNSTSAPISSNPIVANLFSLEESADADHAMDAEQLLDEVIEDEEAVDMDEEDEVFFLEMDSDLQNPIIVAAAKFVDPMNARTPPPPPPPKETAGKDHLLATLKNGYSLPAMNAPKPLTRCHNLIKEYDTCESSARMIALNGTEHNGFCTTQQDSAKLALDFEVQVPALAVHKKLLQHVAVSGSTAFGASYKIEDKLNDQDDIGVCFKAGSVVEQDRYNVKGGFKSIKLGYSSGLFKPTLQVRCNSVYCKYNYVEKISYYDFQP